MMRIKINPKPEPAHGTTKVKAIFTFLPKKLNDEISWLETVKIFYVFVSSHEWLNGYGHLEWGWNETWYASPL